MSSNCSHAVWIFQELQFLAEKLNVEVFSYKGTGLNDASVLSLF